MRKLLLISAMTVALAGCGSEPAEPTKVQSIKVGATNPFQEQLQSLSKPY